MYTWKGRYREAMQITAAYGGDELRAQEATVPPDPYSLDEPPLDQFPLRVCPCPLCIMNRLCIATINHS